MPNRRLRPRKFTEVLDGVFRTFRSNLQPIWIVCATFIGLGTFFLYFSIYQLESRQGDIYVDPYGGPFGSSDMMDMILVMLSMLVYLVAYLFLAPLAGTSVTGITRKFVRGESPVTVREAFGLIRRYGWQTLLTVLLKWLMILAAAVVPLIPSLLLGVTGIWWMAAALMIPGGFVSFGILVFFHVRFYLAIPVILEENTAYWGALKRSWQLTRSSFWWIFGLLFMLYLILNVFNMLPSFLQLLLMIPAEIFLPAQWFWVGNLIAAVIMASLTALISAPTWIAATLLYYERRARKEGLDLIQEAGRLEETAL